MKLELIASFLLFCIGQCFVLIGVFAQKKFRRKHHLVFQGVLALLIIFYFLAYFRTRQLYFNVIVIDAFSQLIELGMIFLLFNYFKRLIGITARSQILIYAKRVSLLIVFLWFILFAGREWGYFKENFFGMLNQAGIGIQLLVRSWYLFYPVLLLVLIKKDKYWRDFLFAPIRKGEDWVRLLAIIILAHGIIRVGAVMLAGVGFGKILGWIDLFFFLIPTYVFSFVFITAPETLYPGFVVTKPEKEKSKKSRFTDEEIKHLMQRMDTLMKNEKLYLDSEFSLNDFADYLGLSVHQLSEILNHGHGLNFNDYVNRFRIEEFKNLLKEPRFANNTLLAVAFEAGFNSKTTFNTSFKKFTGMTPSQFKQSSKN